MESETEFYVQDVYAKNLEGKVVRMPLVDCVMKSSGIITGRDPMSGQLYYVRNWDRCKERQP